MTQALPGAIIVMASDHASAGSLARALASLGVEARARPCGAGALRASFGEEPRPCAAIVELACRDAVGADELARVLVIARARAVEDLGALLGNQGFPHWIALAPDAVLEPRDLSTRAASIALGCAEAWPGRVEETLAVVSGEDGARCIAQAEAFARARGASMSMVARLTAITDELISNALRAKRFEEPLARRDAILVEFASSGRRLRVGVRDPFGRLTRAAVMDALARGHRGGRTAEQTKHLETGGAGLGLYYVLGLADDLTVTCALGEFTEVAAVVAPRADASFHRGFDVFVQGEASAASR